jgi:hypothetical protein
MHRVFQNFVDPISNSGDATDLRNALADSGKALDLGCFALMPLPPRSPELNPVENMHKLHRRTCHRLADRCCISRIRLAPLTYGLT